MHRFIIFILGGAIAALALAVVSISAVAVIAQTTALLSQCLIVLGLFGLGAVVVGSMALRNRVIQMYLAHRLLGADADRLLTEGRLDRIESLPNTFSQNLYLPMGNSRPARIRSIQTPSLTLPAVPAVPQGWGFDEED
jgi:hypothetical protein